MSEARYEFSTPLMLNSDDLKRIGHTTYSGDRGVNFVCSLETAILEKIVLRNIIAYLGYEMDVGSDSYSNEDEDIPDGITFATSLPWDEYQRITA